MLEALWSVEFITTENIIGAGVAVFETGRVFGGDSQYFYLGTYSVGGGVVTGRLRVTHFHGPPHSAFGLATEFNLQVSGPVRAPVMELRGNMVEDATKQIHLRLTKRAELP